MPPGLIIRINAASFGIIARNMGLTAARSRQHLGQQVSLAANRIARELKNAAPVGTRVDSRYATRLRDSFYTLRSGIYDRVVLTSTPDKFAWTNTGARPPSAGTGYIFPRHKSALWWPGLAHPIAFVGPPMTRRHPGVVGTHWADRVIDGYINGSIFVPGSAAHVAQRVADFFVTSFTAMNQTALGAALALTGIAAAAQIFGGMIKELVDEGEE